MGLMLSSRSCLIHQNKFVDSSTATHGAADWRMLAVRRLPRNFGDARLFENPAKRAIPSDSFAARRLNLHQREPRCDAIDRLPAIPQLAQEQR